jgi:hypothetical protein
LLGRYDEFPGGASRLAQFAYSSPAQALQAAIIRALHALNQQTVNLATLTAASPPNCFVNFEFGVADSDAFCFIDQKELSRLEKTLKTQPMTILDVFCGTRYHIKKDTGEKKSLQFDYSVLRFTFENGIVDLSLHFIRGNQRIPRKDFILYLKSQIDKELVEKKYEPMTLKRLL